MIVAMQIAMVVTNLGRIPVLSTDERDFPLAFNELCLAVMLAACAMAMRSWRRLRFDRVALLALLFAAIGAGSAFGSVDKLNLDLFDLIVSLSFLARWLMYFALYVAVINVIQEDGVEPLWAAIETMLVIFAAFGLIQAAFLPGFAQMITWTSRSQTWDEQGHRLVSTVLEPNIAGTMLMIGSLVQISRIAVGARVSPWRVVIMFAALVVTISRSAAIGFMFGMLVILAARGLSKRLVRFGIVGGIVFLLASPLILQYAIRYNKFTFGEGTSAGARVASWLQAIQVIADNPVFGIGFNTYRYAVDHYGFDFVGTASYGVDGGLLFIMAMTGLVGLSVYCLMLWLILTRARSIWRDESVPSSQRGLAVGTAAATVGVVMASAFVNAILTTFVMEMLWILWGLNFVIARRRDERAIQQPRELALAA